MKSFGSCNRTYILVHPNRQAPFPFRGARQAPTIILSVVMSIILCQDRGVKDNGRKASAIHVKWLEFSNVLGLEGCTDGFFALLGKRWMVSFRIPIFVT